MQRLLPQPAAACACHRQQAGRRCRRQSQQPQRQQHPAPQAARWQQCLQPRQQRQPRLQQVRQLEQVLREAQPEQPASALRHRRQTVLQLQVLVQVLVPARCSVHLLLALQPLLLPVLVLSARA